MAENDNRTALPTDGNHKVLLGGVSTADGRTPVAVEVDPVTGALVVAGIAADLYMQARIDVASDPLYFGFEHQGTGNWYIQEMDLTNGTVQYFAGTGGIATGSNWTGRAGHAYVDPVNFEF